MNEKEKKEKRDQLKQRLHQYQGILSELDQIAQEIQQVEALMRGPRGSSMDGMPKAPGVGNPVLGMVTQHVTLLDRYREKIGKLEATAVDIENLIDRLEPTTRRLMRHRYIEGLTWEEVCVAIGYSWRQTHNLHAKALDAILALEEGAET